MVMCFQCLPCPHWVRHRRSLTDLSTEGGPYSGKTCQWRAGEKRLRIWVWSLEDFDWNGFSVQQVCLWTLFGQSRFRDLKMCDPRYRVNPSGQIWPQCWHCWHWTAPIAFDSFPRVEKTWKKCRWDVSVFSKCVLVKCRLKTYLQKIPRDIGPKFVWTVGINSLPVLLVKFIVFFHIDSFKGAYFRGNHTFWWTGITFYFVGSGRRRNICF